MNHPPHTLESFFTPALKPEILAAQGFVPYGRLLRVSRFKLSGFGRHEGVLLPNGMVVHATAATGGIEMCTFLQFSSGRDVQVEAEVPRHMHNAAVQRINDLVAADAKYDAINNNCEMFARAAVLQKPWSPQVVFWLVLGIAAGTWYFGGRAAIR